MKSGGQGRVGAGQLPSAYRLPQNKPLGAAHKKISAAEARHAKLQKLLARLRNVARSQGGVTGSSVERISVNASGQIGAAERALLKEAGIKVNYNDQLVFHHNIMDGTYAADGGAMKYANRRATATHMNPTASTMSSFGAHNLAWLHRYTLKHQRAFCGKFKGRFTQVFRYPHVTIRGFRSLRTFSALQKLTILRAAGYSKMTNVQRRKYVKSYIRQLRSMMAKGQLSQVEAGKRKKALLAYMTRNPTIWWKPPRGY